MKSSLIVAFVMSLLLVGCGGEKGSQKPGGGGSQAPTKAAGPEAFPERGFAKVKDGFVAGENALNDKLVTDLIGVAPAAEKIVGKAIQALDRKKYYDQLDELAKKVGLADNQALLGKFQALQRSYSMAKTLLGVEGDLAGSVGSMVPQMIFDQIKSKAKGSKLTRADLEYTVKNMSKLKVARKPLKTISGSCLLLLKKK